MPDARVHSKRLFGQRWMLFVDGENFTKRGQVVLGQATPPVPGSRWRRDVYLWLGGSHSNGRSAFFAPRWIGRLARLGPDVPPVEPAIRAYYYTSTESDEPEWTQTRLALRELEFEPRVFKRASGRSKAVDVALATEVLTLAVEDRYDVAVIFAGDGDYTPLVEAIKRIGKTVVVGFFVETGLSPELRIAADEFVDLTEHLRQSWRKETKSPANDDEADTRALAGPELAASEPDGF